MNSLEQAYEKLAAGVLEYCGVSKWQSSGSVTSVFAQMTQSSYWRVVDGELIENDRFPALEVGLQVSAAALFLRDEMKERTGHRLWKIEFTIQPDGNFKIQYDYNKPEDFEETEETVDVSLSDFAEKISRKVEGE